MGRPLWSAIGLTVGFAVVWAALGYGTEVLLGVGAPAITTTASWLSVTRTWAAAPGTVFAVLVRGFAVKCLFFAAWVTIVVKGLEVRMVPFVASLTASFVVLHLVEAWSLKRLMAGVLGEVANER